MHDEPHIQETDGDHLDERWSAALALAVAAAVVLPFLGAVGFFDPWETHYAEVARQMVVRDDYLYPFWKDAYFFSKPILLFWLTAPFYGLLGAHTLDGPIPLLAELCGRLPSAGASLMCVAAVYLAARRLWGRRAALLSSVVLGTVPLWAFLARQAITDMLYVATASAGLLLLAVALFGDDDLRNTEKTQSRRLPQGLVVVAAVAMLPQLWEVGRTAEFLEHIAATSQEGILRLGVSIALCSAGVGLLWWLARRARDPLLHAAALCFALSMLAKGPVGLALCALTLVVAIALLGEWKRLLRPAAVSSTVLFLAIAAPWPVVMAVFSGVDDQGKTWVERFILYDLLGRVGQGAHGDRGSFDYYMRYAGFGMFPWSGFVPPALFSAVVLKGPRTPASRFTLLVAVWFVVTFGFFALTTTKFHHYILPLCVPAALLVGRFLDHLLDDPDPALPLLALVCVGATILIGRDLVTEPWQLIDLFTYHYKSFKPDYYFPPDQEWTTGLGVACFGAAALIGVGALIDILRRTPHTAAIQSWPWNVVLERRSRVEGFVIASLGAAFLFSVFAVQIHFNRASQHWTQRHIVSTYHAVKQGDEPLIAYQMDWKGETFYGKNQEIQIKKSGTDLKERCAKPGREFVIVQTDRLGALKSALGRDFESKIHVVDRSNRKWYLVRVDDTSLPD